MFRHFVIALNTLTFLWAQIAFAAGPDQMTKYNEFLKDSGITQHPVALKELVAKFGSDMPDDLRAQWEALVKENPNLMMPKIDAKKILINGEDELQLNVNTNGNNLVVTTKKSKDVWATVVGTKNGKTVSDNITFSDLLSSPQGIYKLRSKMWRSKGSGLLSMDVYKKMDPQFQVKYLQFVRQKLADVERVQYARAKLQQPQVNSVFNMLFQQALLGEAYAVNKDNCVVAGNTDGTFTSVGYCHSNDAQGAESKVACGSVGMLHCNPLFYGDGVCVPGKNADDFAQATVHCDQNGDPDLKKIAQKLANAKDDVFNEIDKMVNQTADICYKDPSCTGIQANCKKNIEDQKKACSALLDRRDRIRDLFCSNKPKDVEAQKQVFEQIGWDTIKKIQDREHCSGPGSPNPPPPAPQPKPGADQTPCPTAADPNNTHCETTDLTCMDPATKQQKPIKVYKEGSSKEAGYEVKDGKCQAVPHPAPVDPRCNGPQAPENAHCSVEYIACPDGKTHTVYGGSDGTETGWYLDDHRVDTPSGAKYTYECKEKTLAKKEKETDFWKTYGDDFILGGAILGITALAYVANKQNLKAYRNAVVGTTTTSTIVPSTTTTTPTAPTPGSYKAIDSVVIPGTR